MNIIWRLFFIFLTDPQMQYFKYSDMLANFRAKHDIFLPEYMCEYTLSTNI
jgi:hypothetical protein